MVPRFVTPDIHEATRLLEANHLPADDLNVRLLENFLAIQEQDELLAMGGLEILQSVALLRSIVVRHDQRGRGIAGQIVSALEEKALSHGVHKLYLLTTDAEDYFLQHGYERIERKAVPNLVKDTPQFSDLCPDSATVMRKVLD